MKFFQKLLFEKGSNKISLKNLRNLLIDMIHLTSLGDVIKFISSENFKAINTYTTMIKVNFYESCIILLQKIYKHLTFFTAILFYFYTTIIIIQTAKNNSELSLL